VPIARGLESYKADRYVCGARDGVADMIQTKAWLPIRPPGGLVRRCVVIAAEPGVATDLVLAHARIQAADSKIVGQLEKTRWTPGSLQGNRHTPGSGDG
jgi:hypothetical protein